MRDTNSRYVGIDLATGVETVINFTGQVVASADVVFLQHEGTNYLIVPSSNHVGLLNLDTRVSTRKTITGMPASGAFGGSWSDFNGRILVFHNQTGEVYELFDVFGPAPYANLAAQGDPSGSNDGFSCSQALFPNFAPVALDDDFITPFNVALSGNVLSDNGNGADLDPEERPLTVRTPLISQPSNGSVTFSSTGDFTYTANLNYSGTDSFVYEIADDEGITAQAVGTITISPEIIEAVAETFPSINGLTGAGSRALF